MIRSFHVENFKCFDRLDIADMAPVTVLGGRNNVGKSSLLEAVFLLYDRHSPQMPIRHMGWRGLRQYASGTESLFAPLFPRFDTSSVLRLEAATDGETIGLELSAVPDLRRKKIRFLPEGTTPQKPPRSLDSSTAMETALKIRIFRDGQVVNTGELLMGGAEVEIRFEQPRESAPPAVFIGARMYTSPTQDAERFGELDIRGEADLVVDSLRGVDPAIKSLSSVATEEGALIHADVGIGRKIPVNFLGDGVSRLLSIVLAMAHARDGCVLIDEIDSGLHHSVLPNVWRWIADAVPRFGCQLIATTHNYGCLEAASRGLCSDRVRNDFAYFRLEQGAGGAVAKRYSFSLLDAAMQEGWEVR